MGLLPTGGGTQTESVGPACILRDCAPLELTGAVIVLVAMLMVYDRIAVRIRYEHFGYQYMDLHIFAIQADAQITAPVVEGFQHAPRTLPPYLAQAVDLIAWEVRKRMLDDFHAQSSRPSPSSSSSQPSSQSESVTTPPPRGSPS